MIERKGKVWSGQRNSTYSSIYFKNFGHIPKSAIRLEKFVITIFVCPRQKSKSIVRVYVCVYEERERVYMCGQQQELKNFCFISKFIMQKRSQISRPNFSFLPKKDMLRLIVGARGTG